MWTSKEKQLQKSGKFKTLGFAIACCGERSNQMYVLGRNSVGRVKGLLEGENGGKETN